ncbi:MAG: FtsX-like permease family protein [Actinomycetota bacterium]
MFRLSLKMTLARKGRLLLTSLAIILGTGFLAGTYIFSDTLNSTFDRLFSDVFKDVDAYVRSSSFVEAEFGGEQRGSAPIGALETVLAVPGVKAAAPDVQGFARIIGKDGKPLGVDNGPPTFGGIASSSAAGLWIIEDGRLPVGSTEMVMDKKTAKTGKFVLGDTVRINAQSGSREFTMVGIANYGDVSSPGGATFALFDQQTASEFLLKPGFVDAFLVQGDGTLSDEQLATAINAALLPNDKLETITGAQITQETQDQIGVVLGFLTLFLTAFSFIALGIGCFVIYNVFSITTAQRLKENALMRAIGANKRQVVSAMLVEALIIGLLGSALGFLSGIGLSRGLGWLLNAFGIEIPTKGLTIHANRIVLTMIVGTVITILSAILPALRAGRVPPLAALRDTALENVGSVKRRVAIGVVAMFLGAGAITATAAGATNVLLGIGVLLVFAGVLIIGPGIARPVALSLGRPIEKLRGVTGAMARQNSARNPKRTARTAAPVLIGVALVAAMTVFAASVRSEARTAIGDQFQGDYIVSSANRQFGGLTPSLAPELAKIPGVAQSTGLGFTSVNLDGSGRFLVIIDPATAGGLITFNMVQGDQSKLSANGILVNDSRALANGWKLGSNIEVAMVDGTKKIVTVEGTFTSSRFGGSYVVSRSFFAGTLNNLFDTNIYIRLADGVNNDQVYDALTAATTDKGLGTLQSRDEFIDAESGQINQLLGLIYGLLGLSIIIAIVGIIITLLLSVFERRREIGLLRAIGMTRSQVRTMVRWESVITSMFGAIVGVALGIVMGFVLIFTLADSGTSAFSLPIAGTIWILVLSFIIGVVAAVFPAWRATRTNIIAAIASN